MKFQSFLADLDAAQPVAASNLTVVVPMAGAGSRFEQAGYADHKPMIPVFSETILGLSLKSLVNVDARFVFIVQRQHHERYDLGNRLRAMRPGCVIIQIDGLTEGAACTLLKAREMIDNDRHLIVINSDNLIVWERDHLLDMLSADVDGGIVVFKDTDPKWSFARLGDDGYVAEVAEKRPISDLATCFGYDTPVLLPDGSTEIIGKLVNQCYDGEVMSYNSSTGLLEPKRVINWVKNDGRLSRWYSLSYADAAPTNTGHQERVLVTGDHQIMTRRGYVRVDSLVPTDEVLTKYRCPNEIQRQLIDGTLLGDGMLRKPNGKGERGRFVIKQSGRQADWASLKAEALVGLPYTQDDTGPSSGTVMGRAVSLSGICQMRFAANPYWVEQRARWYPEGAKRVPADVRLSPLTLAAWWMDDGSLRSQENGVVFCTDSFVEADVDLLVEKLASIGVIARKTKRGRGYRIGVYDGYGHEKHHGSFSKLCKMVRAWFPATMQYKLPEEHRGYYDATLWEMGEAEPFFSRVVVRGVDGGTPRESRAMRHSYCLTVEDNHNFVAGKMIVSNCGIYHWRRGRDFVRCADRMIAKDIRVKNEFYTCPVYNEAVAEGLRIKTYPCTAMHGLGTPEELEAFKSSFTE